MADGANNSVADEDSSDYFETSFAEVKVRRANRAQFLKIIAIMATFLALFFIAVCWAAWNDLTIGGISIVWVAFVVVLLAVGAIEWTSRRVRFCPQCKHAIGAGWPGAEPIWCPCCLHLIRPAEVLCDPAGEFHPKCAYNLDDSYPILQILSATLILVITDGAEELTLEPTDLGFSPNTLIGSKRWEMLELPMHLRLPLVELIQAVAKVDASEPAQTKRGRFKIIMGLDQLAAIDTDVLIDSTPSGPRVVLRFLNNPNPARWQVEQTA